LFLKCILVPRLTLFRLSPLIWLGSCSICNLSCFLWCNNSEYSSSNHGLFCLKSALGIKLCIACLLTDSLFITFAPTRWCSLCITISFQRLDTGVLECCLLPVFPTWEVQVYLWMLQCRSIVVLLTVKFVSCSLFH
jgi:hypothetical protein